MEGEESRMLQTAGKTGGYQRVGFGSKDPL